MVPSARPARVSTTSGAPALASISKQIDGGLVGANFDGLLQQNRPGVEAFFKQHGGVAGEGVAHGDGPLDGRRAAILGQQRPVQIDAAKPRQSEHPRRNDAAVGDDDDRVGRDGFKLRAKLGVVADLFGLRDGMPAASAACFTGGAVSCWLAAHGAVGLRDHQRDLVAGREQCFERGHGELGVPQKTSFRQFASFVIGFTMCLRSASCESCADSGRA